MIEMGENKSKRIRKSNGEQNRSRYNNRENEREQVRKKTN